MESKSAVGTVAVPAGGLIEPAMAMALNMHSSPGVYALLLGAGISIASGVKTGWGVVQDIVGKVAAVRDPDNPDARAEATADPEKWWEANTSEPLGYSALLAAAAPMPASRQAMLAEYFEPEEGQEDSKSPTAGHRAIAQLVKRGSIRVILTTNFDRLTERALQEVGISPQVVSRPEQIKGMKPLTHSQVTVIKLHGDYADLEQRNTVDELETYPEELQQLLERVLDEYGLIVCGWSADWDKALVRAVQGTRSRRYPLFWSQYGRFSDAARSLTAQHGAVVIDGMSADELFTGLVSRVEALDRLTTAPITRDVAVVQLKRALPDPVRRIELSDLVDHATTQILARSTRENRPVSVAPADRADIYDSSIRGYRADSDTLLHLLASGVFHDDGTHETLWLRAVERLTRIRGTFPSGSFDRALEALRHYPALLAAWTMGVTAVIARREEFVATIMAQPTWTTLLGKTEVQAPAVYLNPKGVLQGDLNSVMPSPEGKRWLLPESLLLRKETREPLQVIEPDDTAYQAACTRFEFLASMIAMDHPIERRRFPWVGEFLSDEHWEYDTSIANTIKSELTPDWPLLRAGAFGGDPERAQTAHERLTQWRAQNPQFHW
ncbi:SIR2 family protein [Streptomyces nigra]|uniref:SIR2 family protein n=1 Tax=Streptomyces nigra TaxID=1827580 RepID=UPI0037D3F58F